MKALFALLGILVFASACGEQFQARYLGPAEVNAGSCGNIGETNIEVDVNISGGSMTTNIVSISNGPDFIKKSVQGSNAKITTSFDGQTFSGKSGMNNQGGADAENQKSLPDGAAQITGNITASRDKLTFLFIWNTGNPTQTGQTCTITVSANNIQIQN